MAEEAVDYRTYPTGLNELRYLAVTVEARNYRTYPTGFNERCYLAIQI